MNSARYVILHHRLADGEHWDLMLEHGDILLTWQLLLEPKGPASLPIPARRIGDHRKAYLEYEGPVSGGRGTVRRIDRGTVEIVEIAPDRCRFRLQGGLFKGRFEISGCGDDCRLAACELLV